MGAMSDEKLGGSAAVNSGKTKIGKHVETADKWLEKKGILIDKPIVECLRVHQKT
tara:strand:- start:1591 stop:1755 length:165 start_codon:yes stop_codon:yes gene_type:complete